MLNYFKKLFKPSNNKFLKEASYDEQNKILTLLYSDEITEQYHADGSIWHKMPMMVRCNTLKEYELCDIRNSIKYYGNPYPNPNTK